MAIEDFLDQVCDIKRQARDGSGVVPQDELGGAVRDPYVTVHAGVPCLVRPLGADNTPRHERAGTRITHRVYFDEDLGITSEYQVHVDGMVLTVVGPVNFNSMGELIALDCTEVRV